MSNTRFSQFLSGTLLYSLGGTLNMLALLAPTTAGAIALKLFSMPRPSKARKHQEAFIAGAKKLEIGINGVAVRYYIWEGKGPAVLLAHGWESNASRWAPLISALQREGFAVYALDAPAHGASGGSIFTVKLYAEVLQELMPILRPDVLVGHSAGGMAAVFMLHQAPEMPLQRLVLLSVPAELEQLMDTFRRMSYMGERVFGGMQRAFVRRYGWQMKDFSLSRFIAGVEVPGLLLHDREDPVAPYAGAIELHRHWRGSTFIPFEGLGHSLPGEQVIQTIVNHLGQVLDSRVNLQS